MQTFKVYYPSVSTSVFTLEDSEDKDYPLFVGAGVYCLHLIEDGRRDVYERVPRILHATEENRVKLSELFGVEFDKVEEV